jgi:LmbE family N-acetylglucosaminyl deacetylase
MPRRLLAVLAHPDDETLGFGGTLAKYAAEGVEVSLVTATRGEMGRYTTHARGSPQHPGPEALGRIREAEVRAAAKILGIGDLTFLDYRDQALDQAEPREVIARIVFHLRRLRPDVVLTFGPEGAYGHPDHIAICQFTTAAVAVAGNGSVAASEGSAPPHQVGKLYYIAWPESTWTAYQHAFKRLVSVVDGVDRQAVPWPDWALTTAIDTRAWWTTVRAALECHVSQLAGYERLEHLPPEDHEALWGAQSFYRVYSLVNGGRRREADLFDGIG